MDFMELMTTDQTIRNLHVNRKCLKLSQVFRLINKIKITRRCQIENCKCRKIGSSLKFKIVFSCFQQIWELKKKDDIFEKEKKVNDDIFGLLLHVKFVIKKKESYQIEFCYDKDNFNFVDLAGGEASRREETGTIQKEGAK